MTSEDIREKTHHIPSSVYQAEQALWLEKLAGLPGRPLIVDFGTGWGKSASSLALACPQAQVATMDIGKVYLIHHNVETYEDYQFKVENYIKEAGVTNVQFFLQSSVETDVAEFLRQLGRTEIDVLNIDSDHSYEQTKEEIRRWVPLVKAGGLIFLHDWEHPKAPGVRQAWDELMLYKEAIVPERVWIQPSPTAELEVKEDAQREERGNIPADMVAEVDFIGKANSPIVTTAAFRKLL